MNASLYWKRKLWNLLSWNLAWNLGQWIWSLDVLKTNSGICRAEISHEISLSGFDLQMYWKQMVEFAELKSCMKSRSVDLISRCTENKWWNLLSWNLAWNLAQWIWSLDVLKNKWWNLLSWNLAWNLAQWIWSLDVLKTNGGIYRAFAFASPIETNGRCKRFLH